MGQRRVTVRDAATYLDISEGAVRNRLSRGTLEGVKVDGVAYVVLEDVTTDTDDMPPTDAATDHRDELITVLREQLEAEREANRENRRIIMQQAQNLAAIEAPEESVSPATQREESWETRAEPQSMDARERVPWWRKLFGR
jgi:hypothetical protein